MKITVDVKTPDVLGKVIQQMRMQNGVSQRELANRLGFGQKWLWNIEQGNTILALSRLFQIFNELNLRLFMELDVKDVNDEQPHR